MSDAPANLQWIGSTLRAIQAELRTIRDERETMRREVADVRAGMGSLEAVIGRAVGDHLAGLERRLVDRIAAFEARSDTRLDGIMQHLGIEPSSQ